MPDLLTATAVPAFAGVVAGVAAGYAVGRIRALEVQCDLLKLATEDVLSGIADLDRLLDDNRVPSNVREPAIVLLMAYANTNFGKKFARGVFMPSAAEQRREMDVNPISQGMEQLAIIAPDLARMARRAFLVLTMGLAVMYLHDEIELVRVEREAAKDPEALWSRIDRGRLAHAA